MFAPTVNLTRALAATFIIVGACLCCPNAWAQTARAPKRVTDYGASVWKQSEGLPNNSLRALLQTSDGYLWAGTKGGLARFNGTTFATYSARTPGQLVESEVRALIEGNDGSLYIGTLGGGLSILKDDKFTTLRKADGLAHDVVRTLCLGDNGDIWIGTDGGVNRLREGTLKTFDEKAGLLASEVRALSKDRTGRLWVGTREGLFVIDGETVIDRSRKGAVGDREVSAMATDAEGQMWVATSDGSLFRSDGDSFALIPSALTPGGRIETLHVDVFDHLWLGTVDGAHRLADGKLQHYPRFVASRTNDRYIDALPISDIWAITSDREGNIWLGSSETGLIRLSNGRFHGITASDGLPSSWVNSLFESADGDLYIGTAGGLAKVRGDHVSTVSLRSSAENCSIWALLGGDDGVVWVGSSCGIFAGKGDLFAKVPLPAQDDERPYAIATTRDGNLWLGYAHSGLLRVSQGGETRWFTTKDGLPSNSVRAITETPEGTLLVATLDGGINQIEGDQVTTSGALGNDAMASVYHMVSTSDGALWFATRHGLVRRKDGSDVLLPAGHGMPPVEFFFKIIEDDFGYLWLTSAVGIFRVPLADLNALADRQDQQATVAWFTNEDGMPSASCSQTTPNSVIPCQGSRLCFATNGGLAIVEPKSALPNPFAPPVYIENVLFDGAPVEMKAGVVLGPGRNDIEFDYAGLEYTFPLRVNFRYRLNGWDKGWSEPVERRAARYTNLAPGDYQFEVIASNSDGLWNGAPATFDFRIAPRFYQTKSFYFFSAVALLGIVGVVIGIRTRRLKRQTIELEKMVEKRTEAVAQRNQDMRRVLDNVNQGFLTIDAEGKLALERSAIVDRWFGAYPPETHIVSFMREIDPDFADRFQFGFEVLMSDMLPLELAIAQLPGSIKNQGREYRCAYTPLLETSMLKGLLLVINDVTSELRNTRHEAARKELLSVFDSLTRDRSGFLAFFDEASELIGHLAQADAQTQKGTLHTLKGNAGLVGLGVVASICHQLEDEVADSGLPLNVSQLSPLQQRWQELSDALGLFLGEKGRDVLELNLKELEGLAEDVRAGASRDRQLDRLASWWLEETERPLDRLGRYAGALAARLGKGDLQVEIQSHGVRLTPKTWAGFWAELVHVVRNAVDHGVESPRERRQSGKTAPPRLRLSTWITERQLVVEVEDNGRGIDWEAVRRVAAKLNLPDQTEDDLVDCLFASGLTTRDEVTTVSGRGVGLAAVRRHVVDRGGTISVAARKSEGTCVRFEFPLSEVGPRFGIDPGDAPC